MRNCKHFDVFKKLKFELAESLVNTLKTREEIAHKGVQSQRQDWSGFAVIEAILNSIPLCATPHMGQLPLGTYNREYYPSNR